MMGLFTRQLTQWGFTSYDTVFIRCAIASILFGLTLLIKDRSQFRMRLCDLWCFIGSGICSLLFFTVCYVRAIELMSLSTAAILLYTAPSFVMLLSLLFFKERLNWQKLTALAMAFIGCCLVSGIGSGSRLSAVGLLYGLCAGFGYALYSIFARFAMLRGYDSLTINFYSCLMCALGAGAFWGVGEPLRLMMASSDKIIFCLLFGLIVSYLPYLLYTYGLTETENGKASVMASVEPVMATLIGILVFHEKMTFSCVLGILFVLGAILVLNRRATEEVIL